MKVGLYLALAEVLFGCQILYIGGLFLGQQGEMPFDIFEIKVVLAGGGHVADGIGVEVDIFELGYLRLI